MLRFVGGDRRAAEDVVQETLLRAWQHADALRVESAGPWLFTVARNLAVSETRRRTRRAEAVVDMDSDAPPQLDPNLEALLDGVVVSSALESLSPAHRDVVVELYYRGQTVAEASRRLGVPEGTVKSRSFYALRALREALMERGVSSL